MRRIIVAAVAAAVASTGLVLPISSASAKTTPWKPRAEQYPNTVVEKDLAIRMDDGVVLRADLERPADANGKPVATKLPVIVTITAYNKSVLGSGGALAGGGSPGYLTKRGYLKLTVDARGTGSSGGTWCAFCARETKDYGQVMTWAAEQPWSNGSTAMAGPSYMGIAQLYAAAAKPKGLKAIFPQVPAYDVYRDVVASGGAVDLGFMPLWLGIVTATSIVPPAVTAKNPTEGLGVLLQHVLGNSLFSATMMLKAMTGGEPSFDGTFYRERSPGEVLDRVSVPTFLIGGEYDIFQRGTPLVFEHLQKRKVPVKAIVGPWDHIQGSSGAGLTDAGYGTIEQLQLRWFDHYVKKLPNQQIDQIAPFSYYEQGSGKWARTDAYMPATLKGTTFNLSGTARTAGAAGGLTQGAPTAGKTTVPAIPVQGLCTRSTNQWTAGMVNMILANNPCFTNNTFNDQLGPVFETPVLTKDVVIHGPLNARLYTSTPAGNGMLSVTVSDVAPDGTVSRLSGGWQVVSHRALDTRRSRYVGKTLVQPYHPHTKESRSRLAKNAVEPVDVEVFTTRARVAKGHKLRVSVQALDIPHLLPILSDLPGSLVPLTIHTGPSTPSAISFGTP